MKTIAAFGASELTIMHEFLGALTQGPKSEALTPNDHEHDNEACIANISPRERLKRLLGGVIPLVLALGILSWQISTNVDRPMEAAVVHSLRSSRFRLPSMARQDLSGAGFARFAPTNG